MFTALKTYDLGADSRGGRGAITFESGAVPDRLVDFRFEGAAGFYDQFYEQGAGAGLAALRRFQIKAIGAAADLPDAAGDRVRTWLDVGAGTGAAVDYLNETWGGRGAFRAFGLDPAAPASQTSVHRGDLDAVGLLDGLPARFDVISYLDVLEHFPDPVSIMRRTSTLLEESGCLIVKVPNRGAALYRAAKALRFIAPALSRRMFRRLYQVGYPPPHYYYYDRESLSAVMEQCGFRVTRIEYITETPLAFMWTRLWGFNLPKRIVAFAALVAFKVFCLGPRQECLVVVARKRV